MSLYDRTVDLQLKLEAAQSADASHELLARGARLVESLDYASDYFASAATFRSTAQISDHPNLDLKTVSQAVGAFRAGLSRHGSAAIQHQPAVTLADVAKTQRDRVTRWVAARWKERFAEYEPLLERIRTEHLVGNASRILVAKARAATLRAARGMDPIVDAAQLESTLGGADIEMWLRAITAKGLELRGALEALDTEHSALTPQVSEALRRAATDEGLPLSEVSDELLTALRNAGVDDHLVVRRG